MNNNKSEEFNIDQQAIAGFAKAISHPAKIAIIQLLAEKREIRTGNISDFLPISRPTVSKHLKDLKEMGIIQGTIDGLKIHYCLDMIKLDEMRKAFEKFFHSSVSSYMCNCD